MLALADRYDEDVARCRAILREGSKSFHAASLLLPARVRGPASVVYAFCRVADDAVDTVSPRQAPEALERLRARLERAYAGAPQELRPALTLPVPSTPPPQPEALLV